MANLPQLELAVFLGGIWAAGKGMLDASAFVNDLRDTVVTGYKGTLRLSLHHRRVLRIDWPLTMIGTISFPIVYSALLYVLAAQLKHSLVAYLHTIVLVVCSIPLTGSILFVVCGIVDWRLMTTTLATEAAQLGMEAEARSAPAIRETAVDTVPPPAVATATTAMSNEHS